MIEVGPGLLTVLELTWSNIHFDAVTSYFSCTQHISATAVIHSELGIIKRSQVLTFLNGTPAGLTHSSACVCAEKWQMFRLSGGCIQSRGPSCTRLYQLSSHHSFFIPRTEQFLLNHEVEEKKQPLTQTCHPRLPPSCCLLSPFPGQRVIILLTPVFLPISAIIPFQVLFLFFIIIVINIAAGLVRFLCSSRLPGKVRRDQ